MYSESSVVVVVVVLVVVTRTGRATLRPWEVLNDALISLLLSVLTRLRVAEPGRLRERLGLRGLPDEATSFMPTLEAKERDPKVSIQVPRFPSWIERRQNRRLTLCWPAVPPWLLR